MRVLLTGADNLIGSHILNLLVSGYEVSVRAIVGSKERAYAMQQQYRYGISAALDFTVISASNSAIPETFDNALSDHDNPFHAVVHTLTSSYSNEADCLARFINLESETVVGLLTSIRQVAKQVRRVIIVTSLTRFARWLATDSQYDRGIGSSIQSSALLDQQHVLATSQAGDNIVHDAVSKWWKTSAALFDVVYITAPSCYGPAIRSLETSSDLLEANRQIWNICSNEVHERTGSPPYGIAQFVDVRDLALACVRAIFTASAGNQRFTISAGIMPSSSNIAEYLVACFPELRDRVRAGRSAQEREQSPPNISREILDTSSAGVILGLQQYHPLENTLVDTARQILDLQRRKEWMTIIRS